MKGTKIYRTTYDSFIVVKNANGNLKVYEGKALCPKSVQTQLESGNYTELDAFYFDAISYGWI